MAKIRVKVCVGTNCAFRGGQTLLDTIESDPFFRGRIKIEGVSCLEKACNEGKDSPVVEVDGKLFTSASIHQISDLLYNRLELKEDK